jgi:hypothetical protein
MLTRRTQAQFPDAGYAGLAVGFGASGGNASRVEEQIYHVSAGPFL